MGENNNFDLYKKLIDAYIKDVERRNVKKEGDVINDEEKGRKIVGSDLLQIKQGSFRMVLDRRRDKTANEHGAEIRIEFDGMTNVHYFEDGMEKIRKWRF